MLLEVESFSETVLIRLLLNSHVPAKSSADGNEIDLRYRVPTQVYITSHYNFSTFCSEWFSQTLENIYLIYNE